MNMNAQIIQSVLNASHIPCSLIEIAHRPLICVYRWTVGDPDQAMQAGQRICKALKVGAVRLQEREGLFEVHVPQRTEIQP